MVTQDTSLLHHSIRDNGRYGQSDASEAEIRHAAERAKGGDPLPARTADARAHGDRDRAPAVTIARMDHLVLLEQGRNVEQGTHAALLRAGGAYARMWQRQSGGFLQAAE